MSLDIAQSASAAILPSSLTHELARFRVQLEIEAGEPIQAIETNAALLLSDLCRFFRLDMAQQERVLGHEGTAYMASALETGISLAKQSSWLSSVPDTATPAYEQHD